jgi:hypothetical protein
MENNKILKLPSLEYFGSWDDLQYYLNKKGNPFYSIGGNLELRTMEIETLGNLTSVEGDLDLFSCKSLTSLGNLTSVGGNLDLEGTKIKSLGNLTSVGGSLDLRNCKNLTSFGNLTSVGRNLVLRDAPISKKYSDQTIRKTIDVKGEIFS